MEWKDWVGKKVFIKLNDSCIFSYSNVLAYEEPFLSITDKFGLPVVIDVRTIVKINEERNDGR